MGKKIFEKRLESTDIQQRLVLPRGAKVKELPSPGTPVVVGDENGNPWSFQYSNTGGQAHLSGNGWNGFVNSNNIRVGDLISLYKNDSGTSTGATFTIKVKRN